MSPVHKKYDENNVDVDENKAVVDDDNVDDDNVDDDNDDSDDDSNDLASLVKSLESVL